MSPQAAELPRRAADESESPPRRSGPLAWARARPHAREALAALAAAVLATGFAIVALRLWHARLSLPLGYAPRTDSKFYLMLVKGLLEHGSYLHNPALGAPFGQQLYDFPQGADNLNLLLIRGLGLFSSSPAVVANLFFGLSFPLTAVSAFFVLRALDLSRGAAVVCSTLFALLPYHFYRGEAHLLLSAYYAVPLGAYLVLAVGGARPLFARRPAGAPRLLAWASRRSLATLAICVVIGSAGLYYASFTVILVLAIALVYSLVRRQPAPLVAGSLVGGAIAATVLVNWSPSLAYWAKHGRNDRIGVRVPAESERLGLRLADLVLPVREHRIPLLARVNRHYTRDKRGYDESASVSLGLVATAGFLSLCLLALGRCLAPRAPPRTRPLYGQAAAATLVTFAVATTGGISGLIAYFITPELRGWNRLSLFIAFFSLVAIAMLLQAVEGSERARMRRGLVAAVLGGTLLVGVYDETSDFFIPPYSRDAREYRSDAAFVGAIERRLPARASVFQLPYVPFPEAIVRINHTGLRYYEPVRGYLHSHRLRWSFGAMRGRSADWQRGAARIPIGQLLPGVAASGFDGVWVDRSGYLDRGQRVERELRALLGAPLVSPDHRLVFFDLRAYAGRIAARGPREVKALRDATLHPAGRAAAGTPARPR